MSDTFCTACGGPRSGSAPFCGRCGKPFAAADDAAGAASGSEPVESTTTDFAATRNRASLAGAPTTVTPVPDAAPAAAPAAATAVTTPPPPPDYPPPAYPPPAYPPPPPPYAAQRSAGVAPPQIWLVTVGLIVLAGLLIYPVAEGTPDLVSGVFDDNALSRAFATLFLQFFVMFWACGFALVALAVGLVRGSRVSQLLTCIVAGICAVSTLIAASETSNYSVDDNDGTVAGIVICSIVVILLLTLPGSSRRYYGADPRPSGVSLAATANVYLGAVALIDAMLICLAGAVGAEYVWIGLIFAAVGATLVITSRGLHEGSTVARGITLAVYAALGVAVIWFGIASDQFGQFPTLLPLGIVVAGAAALTLPASSRAHFDGPMASVPLRGPAVVTTVIALMLVAASAVLGFSASGDSSDYSSYGSYESTGYSDPTPDPQPTYVALASSDAESTSTSFLDSLEGTGSASMCSATTAPDLQVYDYRVRDVTPSSSGSFDVTADVTLRDGSYFHVTYSVRDDGSGTGCVDGDTVTTDQYSPDDDLSQQPAVPDTEPTDVPSVVTANDPVPTDATLPAAPSGDVVPYTDDSTVPSSAGEIVEYQPTGLDADQADAVRSVIAFMTHVNQQDFQPAWDYSTERLIKAGYDPAFANGYATTHFMQVAFGQPEQLNSDLIIVPGRFVSRQDPSAQGNPDGVTSCTYWPQYMFLVARVDGRWLLDVARKYQDRSAVRPYKRTSESGLQLNPIQQRVAC